MRRLGLITVLLFLGGMMPRAKAQQSQLDSLLQLLSNHPQHDTQRIELLRTVAYQYYTVNIEQTETYAQEILALADELDYPRGKAIGHQVMGVVYSVQNNYRRALEHYLIALNIQNRIGDLRGKATNLNNLAGIYYFQGDLGKALRYNQQSLQAAESLGDTLAMANGYLSRGMMQAQQENVDSALHSYRLAQKLYRTQQNWPRLASAYREVGQMLEQRDNPQTAREYYQRALNINQQTGDNAGLAYSNLDLGSLELDARRHVQAQEHFAAALHYAQLAGATGVQKRTYRLLADLAQAQGRTEQALAYLENYSQLSDSLAQLNAQQQLASIEERYESEQARQELVLLRKEKELQDTKIQAQAVTIRTQRLMVIGILLLALMAGGLASVLYRLSTTRKRNNQQLARQKRELEKKSAELAALNQTKDRWFSILGDDFRYPLHFLHHALTLVNEGRLNEKERDMLTKELEVRARNAGSLLDNLLYWAQGQLNTHPYRPTYFSLAEAVQEAVAQLAEKALVKHIDIHTEVPTNLQVYGAADYVHVALRNVIENALKYSYQGWQVQITARQEGDYVRVSVVDQGTGIEPGDLTQIFEQDELFSKPGTARERGTGIGLMLTRDVMHRNRGDIFVESEPGQGTTVILVLPTRPLETQDPASVPSEEKEDS